MLAGCRRLERMGRVYVLGLLTDGRPAIWEIDRGGQPVEIGALGVQGERELTALFDRAEVGAERIARSQSTTGSRSSVGLAPVVTTVVVLIIVIVTYLIIHAHRYSGCLVKPSIFAWPSVCV